MLLITHDLGLVSQWADRVAVMYAGQKVEEAATAQLFSARQHPYTRGLLGTSLHMDQDMHCCDSRLPEIHHQPDASGSAFTLITPPPLVHSPHQTDEQPLLSLHDVHTEYHSVQGKVSAANGVSLDIHPGETLGMVGESSCGKLTLSKTILRLLPTSQGSVIFDGEDITHHNASCLASLRQRVQMIFQDPYASLNPRHSIQHILETPLVIHGMGSRAERQRAVRDILD
ncbi:MAG: ATP-binding cassette domain-containing protein [Symbiopectobacterium sp.]